MVIGRKDIAAVSGRTHTGAAVSWAAQVLSAVVQSGGTAMHLQTVKGGWSVRVRREIHMMQFTQIKC